MSDDFFLFLAVGFFAQLVDGSLGMAYGITATTFMLSAGVPPAHASAATHAAEVFTTAASGGSHVMHRNVDWPLFWRLAPAGMVGGAAGAFLLASFDGDALRPFIFAYLGAMGVYVLYRAFRPAASGRFSLNLVPPLGLTGGFFDATGGGGWGPIVTTTLLGAGEKPRFAIGTTNTAEFLVAATVSATFVVAFFSGHWDPEGGLMQHASAVLGLIIGGVAAAPLAGYLVKIVPPRIIGFLVGTLIVSLSIYQIARHLS